MITTKVMTRKIFNNILLVAAMTCGVATTQAAAFEATKLTMHTGSYSTATDTDLSMLGKTEDGYQLWSFSNTATDVDYTYWVVNDTAYISNSVKAFSAGTKYKLSKNFDISTTRSIPTNTDYLYFVKLKSSILAELYILDPANTSTFPSDFSIAANVAMTINDLGYNRDNSKYSQTISWTVTGIDSKIFKEASVEVSFDGGNSWESVNTSTSISGSYTYTLAFPQTQARFRVVARPADAYKYLAKGGEWRSEESADIEYAKIDDFRRGSYGTYGASQVKVRIAEEYSGKEVYMSLIGKTRNNNFQVWACHNTTGNDSYLVWTIDGYTNIRPTNAISKFDNNTVYALEAYFNGGSETTRQISKDETYTHFFVINRKETGTDSWADYFIWDRSAELSFASDYYLNGSVKMTVGDMTYSADKACNVQTVKWACYDVNGNATDKVVVEASYDGGNTWVTAAESAAAYVGSIQVAVPLTASKVRYRVAVYPKDDYRVLVENGRWVSDASADFEQEAFTIPCKLSVGDIKTKFADSTNVYDRTYSPEVSWEILSSGSNAVSGATLEYCLHDGDNEWIKAADITTLVGTKYVAVPEGVDCLTFRLKLNVDETMKAVAANSAEVVVKTAEFAPAFTSFALDGSLEDSYDKTNDLLKPTFNYAMNDDLYQTRQGSLMLCYSTDEGETWKVGGSTTAAKSGTIQATIPANSLKYKFRIGIASVVNNEATCGINNLTDVYDYTPTTILVLDETEAYTPMDVTDRVVKVTRNFEKGVYDTVCLPFDLTEDEINDGFGDGTKMYELTSASGRYLKFNLVNSMEAGKPYIVLPGADKEYLLFDHIDINSATTAMDRAVANDVSMKNNNFCGTFSPRTLLTDGTQLRINAQAELYQPGDETAAINGYRAYFKVPSEKVSTWWEILFKEEISGIGDITVDGDQPVRVYNLRGQYLGNSLDYLPSGVYLVNDKKVVIKK